MKRRYILSDLQHVRGNLLPLTYTCPVGCLTVGIDSIADKWRRMTGVECAVQVEAPYLAEIYGDAHAGDDDIEVASNVLPDSSLVAAISSLPPQTALADGQGRLLARRGAGGVATETYAGAARMVEHPYDIFLLNGEAIRDDFASYGAAAGVPPSASNTVIGDPPMVYIHPGATVEGAIINVKHGPVYVGPGAEVMEGSLLRGPVAICSHATVNMGARIYPGTTVGPWCKVGGELNNVVMFGYSNKAHDGFLGNAVIGRWCNIGAGTTASNLKNDYTPIRLWNYPAGRFLRTDLQFCGLIMGDHSKAGINTMFNTATVLGVGVNIHGPGFPRAFVPSFSEGGASGYTEVSMSRFCDIARRMMARRGLDLTDAHIRMFEAIRHAAEEFK